MPVDVGTAQAGSVQAPARDDAVALAKGKASEPKLTEVQILALLAARRRSTRLQSLQRISELGRTVNAADPGSHPHSVSPPQPPNASPVARLGCGARLSGSAADAGDGGALRVAASGGWPAATQSSIQSQRLEPLRRTGSRAISDHWTAAMRRQRWGLWRDRALLLVELVALVALVVVVTGSFSSMGDLNAELADARRAPVAAAAAAAAAEPTAVTLAAEEDLPGSSTPPLAGPEAEGPLRAPMQPRVISPIATPGAQAASRIVIPVIGVDSVIVEGDTWEDLKKGVGHHSGTANAGEKGNAVYSGHDDVYGEVFRRLEEVKPGDVVTLYAGSRLYRYEVKRTRIVTPKEISVLAPTADATLTLITCYPYLVDTHRLVIIAKLVE